MYDFLKSFLPFGDVAILFSAVDMLANIINASGKFGGVAGVLAGVINWNEKKNQIWNIDAQVR